MKSKKPLTAILPLVIATICMAQPGALDSDFSADGKLTFAFNSSSNNMTNAILIQSDKKNLVAGTYNKSLVLAYDKIT